MNTINTMIKRNRMILKYILTAVVVTLLLTITGCNVLPPPAGAIKPPQYSNDVNHSGEDAKAIARRFLIPGTQFAYPIHPKNEDAVKEIDIEGDGQREIIALYRGREINNNNNEVFGVFILKQGENQEWNIFWQYQYDASIIALDWGEVRDISGDGYPELLLGWSIGYRMGSNLDIFSLVDKFEPKLVSSIKYSEIMRIEDRKGNNNEIRPIFAIYLYDEDMFDSTDEGRRAELLKILRWGQFDSTEQGLIPAKDVYGVYYTDTIEEMQTSLAIYWNDFRRWYVLADAQIKCGKFNDALTSIENALNVVQSFIDRRTYDKNSIDDLLMYQRKFKILRTEAYIELGMYYEAIHELNKISDTYNGENEELVKVYLNLGRAYIGVNQYGNASLYLNKSSEMAELLYGKGSALYIINSYPAKTELQYIKPFISK